MKRLLVLLMVLGLVFGSIAAADAGKKKRKPKPAPSPVKVERILEIKYQCPCGVNTPAGGQGFWVGPAGTRLGGDSSPTGGDDLFVKIEVKDAQGGAVWTRLAQDTDGDLQAETDVGRVCGTSDEVFPVPSAGGEIGIFIYMGTCADGTPSTPTSGTVVLTFSNLP